MGLKNKGKVYLVGAGPGEPELITLKGLRYLKEADVVVYDRLVNPLLLKNISEDCKLVYVGKSPERHTLKQDKINALLVKLAKQGKTVVRLKGGDPFLFGRAAEELIFLARHKIRFEVVPGISSALAVPAYAGIPLTHRDFTSSVGIFTGQEYPNKQFRRIDWEKISCGLGTLIFLMGVKNLSKIVKNLIKFGRSDSTPCCLIQQGSLPEQKSIQADLKTIVDKARIAKIKPPAILVVGDVVSLRKKINWFETKPLFGKNILVTAPKESSPRLCRILRDYGAGCVELPLIKIQALKDYQELDSYIKRIGDFHWLIFTSQNGVKFFKQRLNFLKKDLRVFKGINIACIGERTKLALEDIGLKPDIVPFDFCQEGLVKLFKKINLEGKNILIVRAQEARDLLPKRLKKMGAKVKIGTAYKVISVPLRAGRLLPRFLKDGIDIITFTSPSCVRNFFKVFTIRDFFMVQESIKHFPIPLRKSPKVIAEGDFLESKKKILIASIGPVTSTEAHRFRLKVDIQAEKYTLEGLAEAILKYCQ